MTKQSSVHQPYQPRCYEAYEFNDLQDDFSQFLEEAKHHANEAKLIKSSVHPEESGSGRSGSEKEKRLKVKESWKNSLLSWLKAERKSKHHGKAPAILNQRLLVQEEGGSRVMFLVQYMTVGMVLMGSSGVQNQGLSQACSEAERGIAVTVTLTLTFPM